MDVMSLTAGASGGDSISLTCESELGKFDRSSNLKYTHANQQKKDSTDLFFNFLKNIEGIKISWGKSTSGTGVGREDTGGGRQQQK
jgi:hypothetical protein